MLHLLAMLWVAPAQAGGFDAHGYSMAPQTGDLRGLLSVYRPGRMHFKEWYAMGLVEYARAPLSYVTVDDAGDASDTVVALDHLVALNVGGGFAVHDRVRIDARLPVYFASFGTDGYQGVDIGDLRLSGMVSILRPHPDAEAVVDRIGLGVVPFIDLPTGATEDFLGNAGVSGGGKLAGTVTAGKWTVSSDLGLRFNPTIELENLVGSDTFVAGVGVGYLLTERWGVNVEGVVEAPLEAQEVAGTATPAEVLLSARHHRKDGLHLLGGAAVGISQGAGAAQFRLFVGGGFGAVQEPAPIIVDMDGDGILDVDDTCPEQPETMNQYQDEDGCPDALGSLAVRVTLDGEPVVGAKVELSSDDGVQTYDSTESPLELADRLPDQGYQGSATYGPCLAGTAEATIAADGVTEMVIALEQVLGAEGTVTVKDKEGKPIESARVRWQAQDEASAACVPAEETGVGEDGSLTQELGQGTHNLVVTAEGYSTFFQEMPFAVGDKKAVEALLRETKVRVEQKQIVILEKVYFETAKAIIKEESYALLDEISNIIRANPQIGRVEIAGHTDSQGSDSYNQDLSQRRSDSVRTYLIEKGVNGDRLMAKGYGESAPIASNRSASGRSKNRRVEFNLIDQASEEIETPAEGSAE